VTRYKSVTDGISAEAETLASASHAWGWREEGLSRGVLVSISSSSSSSNQVLSGLARIDQRDAVVAASAARPSVSIEWKDGAETKARRSSGTTWVPTRSSSTPSFKHKADKAPRTVTRLKG